MAFTYFILQNFMRKRLESGLANDFRKIGNISLSIINFSDNLRAEFLRFSSTATQQRTAYSKLSA